MGSFSKIFNGLCSLCPVQEMFAYPKVGNMFSYVFLWEALWKRSLFLFRFIPLKMVISILLLCDLVILLLGIYLGEMKTHKGVCTKVYGSFMHNDPKVEAIQQFFPWWIGK